MRLNKKQRYLVDLFAKIGVNVCYLSNCNTTLLTSEKFNNYETNLTICCPQGVLIRFLDSVLKTKTLGLCEGYVFGFFTLEMHLVPNESLQENKIPDVSQSSLFFELLRRFAAVPPGDTLPLVDQIPNSWTLYWLIIKNKIFNLSLIKQFQVAEQHYDLPPQIFTGFDNTLGMLGPKNKYTCGYYSENEAISLDQAQTNSLEYIYGELQLAQKNHPVILDCGCGWGSIPKYLLETLGEGNFTYIGVTIAQNQVDYCKEAFENIKGVHFFNHSFNDSFEGILKKLRIESLDAIVFLGSLEHAGPTGTKSILENVRPLLKDDGRVYIQIVGADHPTPLLDPYIWWYIFPNAVIMCLSQIGKFIQNNRLYRLVRMDNTADSYYHTLMAWYDNFIAGWDDYEPIISKIIHTTPFATTDQWKRHWEAYLLLCAAFFEAGTYPQLYRITLVPNLNVRKKSSIFRKVVRFLRQYFNI